MKLTNMKLAPPKAEPVKTETLLENRPRYPWGLSVTLEEESIKALGIKDLPDAETKLKLVANVEVSAVSSNDSASGGKRRSVTLQITDMALEAPSAGAEKVLYGGSK